MDIRSKHLSSEDHGVKLAEHNRGSSQRLIGQLLHRLASTICRELARGELLSNLVFEGCWSCGDLVGVSIPSLNVTPVMTFAR
jgi:hypothetical protein